VLFFLQAPPLFCKADSQKTAGSDAVLSGLGINLRDVNTDGRTDMLDLRTLLWILRGKDDPPPSADLNDDSRVNIFDLLNLLRYLADPPEPDKDFEFLVVVRNDRILSGRSIFLWNSIDEQGKVSSNYKIYSNKEIKEIVLILGRDTMTEVEGRTPTICDADTLLVTDACDLSCGTIPWYVRVTDTEGNWRDTMGITEFTTNTRNCHVDPGYPLTGGLIDFPLVLNGPLQRFKIPVGWEFRGDTFRIDLNRSHLDSVVFPDIDSLATAIMEDLSENDSMWKTLKKIGFSRLYVSPAYDRSTSRNVDRLYVDISIMAEKTEIIPEDDNEELMDRLGFPLWRRRATLGVVDQNYMLDRTYTSKYKRR